MRLDKEKNYLKREVKFFKKHPELHREELVEMWETQNFHKIEPLE